jgi:hypothetical protein
MTPLEKRLKDALLEARRKLANRDVVGAGLEIDAACAAMQRASAEDVAAVRDLELGSLVQACAQAARDAEMFLRQEIGRVTTVNAAGRAYANQDDK